MHVDYIKEQFEKLKNPKYSQPISDLDFLKIHTTDEFVDFAYLIGDETIKDICKTMKNSFGYRLNSSKLHRKITDKQQYSIAKFLLNQFGTAENVIKAVFEKEMKNE